MPGHCCVPYCNANYPSGPRVSVFSFPKDEELLKKWLEAVPKKNLVPSHSTKVCQKHFKPEDIISETSAFDTKRQVTITVALKNHRLKPDAVPCIFEDIPTKPRKKAKNSPIKDNQEKDKTQSSVRTSMQSKNAKSPLSSVSETDVLNNTSRQDGERKGTVKSPKKISTTTDRPIIAVIKAEDLITEGDKSGDDMDEDDDCVIEESSPNSNSFSLPSPFKNLPNVSVCLKDEDRVPFTRELKGVKRSPSTGSNSSSGSSEAQKLNPLLAKRRKVEKPAPVVIGRQNDCYCWVCHRENITLCCIACPRAYHPKCAGELTVVTPDWVCPECQRILAAENVDTRSSTLAEISLDKLGALLKLSLNKMKQRAPIAFHQAVSLEHYPLYPHYVIHAMDFSLLEKNIKQKVYGCTEAFLADVKWISHNSCVFNGTQHPLSTNAKNLVKSCDQDMQEIEVCPDCFVHSVIRNKYWFSDVCRKPHPLVWAKLKGFPYWPAKVVRIVDGNVDARFFGAHDRAWVPVVQCYHLSKEMPTTSKPKKKGNYEVALDELNVHVHLLIQKFGCFEYAPYRTSFNPQNKVLMYHGIDIDKVSKEEISFDTSVPTPDKFHSSEKENRFASFLESEREKSNADEMKLAENQTEKEPQNPFKINDRIKSAFHFKERESTDSMFSDKETDEDEINPKKSTIHDKINDEKSTVEEKKTNTSQVSITEISDKSSASDQFRKLELALERIKGYVSLNVDSEKEIGEPDNKGEENKEKNNSVSEEINTEATKKTNVLSPLFNETLTLPEIESNIVQENQEDVTKSLETTKKTDSFSLKLNETIESCKAKLGISEITDDLSSDESGADENGSRSDEDDEDNTSASDAEEELSEDEVMEISDEEEDNELQNNEEDGSEEENSEFDEESSSESSDTDIECLANDVSPKLNVQNSKDFEHHIIKEMTSVDKEVCLTNEDNCKEVNKENIKQVANGSNEATITNPDMQVSEITIDASGALETVGNTSSEIITESSCEVKEISLNEQCNKTEKSPPKTNADAAFEIQLDSVPLSMKDDSCSILIEDSIEINDGSSPPVSFNASKSHNESLKELCKTLSSKTNNAFNASVLSKKDSDKRSEVERKKSEGKKFSENLPSVPCKNEPVDDDDDIFICTPTRPKSPPVIVLDDDAENEDSSVSDTYAIKSPPYSTSAESFSNEENPTCKTTSGDEQGDSSTGKTVFVANRASVDRLCRENKLEMNGNMDSGSSSEKRKRKISYDESSDDEIQVVSSVKKHALTGAKRTFNKPSVPQVMMQKSPSPTLESVKRNLEKGLRKEHKSPDEKESSEMETDTLRPESNSPLQTTQNLLRSPVIDTNHLDDKEKEILFLRSKLNCVLTAYKIQSWKCSQEKDELRHNMNLIIMEMRACLEADKKQAIEALVRSFDQEKRKSIEEAKKKQWCASCLMESRYACCWNTSYCSIECQKRHFPEHRNSCTQVKNKNSEIEMKRKSSASNGTEMSENKKVIIVNMKTPDGVKTTADKPIALTTQQTPVCKPQIQVMSANTALQISSASCSSPIQFLLAPVKSSTEPNVTTSTSITPSSIEKNLDSTQIITQVRNKSCDLGKAISLLKKKNLESTLSILAKKQEKKQKDEKMKEAKQKESKEIKDKQKQDGNLEEIYFPSPPKVTFEGYDATSPEPNLIINETEEAKINNNTETETEEPQKEIFLEPDVVLSDIDDMDDKRVNIGRGCEIKSKVLTRCLQYGKTAKLLTRCLVDVLFPDSKLLATCSAFGQKSNVTKLTRAALPARKVYSIIDFVTKHFPNASRSEIVLAINIKCKEARVNANRKESETTKRAMDRRLLGREQIDELASTIAPLTTSSSSSNPPLITTSKSSPNVVCVKSSNQTQVLPFALPKQPAPVPNILRCSPQLIRPKPMFNTVDTTILPAPPSQCRLKKRETIKTLLSKKNVNLTVGSLQNDGPKLVMAVDGQQSTVTTQPVASTNMRPYIIIGPQVNQAKQPVQSPALPVSSNIKK